MTYLAPRKERSVVRTPFLVAIILAVIVGGLQFFVPTFLPRLALSVAKPFWRAQTSVEAGALHSEQALLAENAALHRDLDALTIKSQNVLALQKQNADLLALLGRASSTPLTLAAVLSHPPKAAYDELILDAGTDHNFSVGDLVYAPGDVLIGRISFVLPHTSTVTLFSSPGQTYEILIGTDHIPATAVGRGGGQYEAQLPRDLHVSEGDLVTAPSLNDIVFGTVTALIANPAEPFEKILFAPPVNVYELRWVLVSESQ